MNLKKWLLAGAAALLMLGFALQPVVSLESARGGLNLFLTVVLPSLLPFMVCANLFIESGAAASAGRLLNPLMRPLFACPGEAAFALTAGLLAGYPTGARIALDLKEKGLISEEDARRTGLLASSCGPVFMLGAVGAGLLGSPAAGWLIACSHWIAVLVTGLVFSVGGNRTRSGRHTENGQNAPPVMEALGVSIKKTVDTLWAVGGYIVLFSVVAGLLKHYNILYPLASALSPLWRLLGLEPSLAQPSLVGAIEMTNGCNAAALSAATLANRCAVLAALVSFGGFCIQAQSMLFLSGVGLSAWKFALAKSFQAAAAFVSCRLLALLPVFNGALCAGYAASGSISSGSVLLSSSVYAAGGMLLFAGLAFVSGRASTRGSA